MQAEFDANIAALRREVDFAMTVRMRYLMHGLSGFAHSGR
jgi:hypothetical protein